MSSVVPEPEQVKKLVQELRDWVDKQPHLPKDFTDLVLRRFLHSCYYDLPRSRATVDRFCAMRLNAPELLVGRDPLSDKIQRTLQIVNLAQFPISGNRKLWIWQLNDPGLERFDYLQDVRVFFLSTDSWLMSDETYEDSDVVLLDVKDISLKFITKFNVSVARKLSKYQEEALPIRLKQIHIVNAPSFIDKIFGLMKPFIKQEYCDMMHFHPPNTDSLSKYFSKEDLPADYGGDLPALSDHMTSVVRDLESKREVFLNDHLWTAIDLKKSKNTPNPGTFRSLDID